MGGIHDRLLSPDEAIGRKAPVGEGEPGQIHCRMRLGKVLQAVYLFLSGL